MKETVFRLNVSNTAVHNKDEALQYRGQIWKTMYPVIMTPSLLRRSIENGQPFLCCNKKKEWNGQQLFCVDVDNFTPTGNIRIFNHLIGVLDAVGLSCLMAYTTFSNPDRKRERFRLLFLLDEPITDLETAWKISKHLYHVVDDLVPGSADMHCVRPYGLYYPGKKVILYRPAKTVRRDLLLILTRELEEPKLVLHTGQVWNRMKDLLEKDPYIPSAAFLKAPPEYLVLLGNSSAWVFKEQEDISTALGKINIRFLKDHKVLYNILQQKKIIDIYINIQGAVEQSKQKYGTCSMTVFEHYQALLSELLTRCMQYKNCDPKQAKSIFKNHADLVYEVMGIKVLPNTPMVLSVRYANYAKAVLDMSAYPNLFRIFQRDIRKQQLLASVILIARDLATALQYPPKTPEQYIITHEMIQEKMQKKFRQTVSDDGITEWLRQFHDLQLIHLCRKEEVADGIKKSRKSPYRKPTIIQIPYFDKTVLIHSEHLAERYKPAVRKTDKNNRNYLMLVSVLNHQLDIQGWFSRDSFIRCIRQETALDNTDGFTEENAATYFDKYIRQVQQELDLVKSPCNKELMVRFPGNHKMGLTRLYYRKQGEIP